MCKVTVLKRVDGYSWQKYNVAVIRHALCARGSVVYPDQKDFPGIMVVTVECTLEMIADLLPGEIAFSLRLADRWIDEEVQKIFYSIFQKEKGVRHGH